MNVNPQIKWYNSGILILDDIAADGTIRILSAFTQDMYWKEIEL